MASACAREGALMQSWITATGRASRCQHPGSLPSERPPGFWCLLWDPWGDRFTTLGFSCLLREMKQLDCLPLSLKILRFSCQGDDVTAMFSENTAVGTGLHPLGQPWGSLLPTAPTQ